MNWVFWPAYEVTFRDLGKDRTVIVPAVTVDVALRIVREKFGALVMVTDISRWPYDVMHYGTPPNQNA